VATDAFAAENARLCLHRAAELLNDDTRGPTPHLCVAFAATSRLLVIVLRIASAFLNDGITHEALGICSLLIDSEEEAFLEDRGFAAVLPEFVRSITRIVPGTDDDETESAFLEVLFGIASRIRVQPELLPVWFKPRSYDSDRESDDDKSPDVGSRSRNNDFPLFYLLLYYVPAEGRAGEFARMGLLYLIESASRSERLERWIVEGDMATLLASGLGALYSQLNRKLALSYANDEIPPILAFSNSLQLDTWSDAEATSSPDYQMHLGTFLASLVFWQDLLEHCTSVDVKQTLLDHFRFLFLQQLLYPSLLESSDVDGGSSVAVLTYLRHVLESIDHPDLVRLTLQYLFGVQSTDPELDASPKPITLVRRRKSENLVHRVANEDENPSPDLFNLTDLILASLGSKNQQTLAATLRLLSVLLRRQHSQTLLALFKTHATAGESSQRTLGGHEKEIDSLLSMAEVITGLQVIEETYERYLLDNRGLLEAHICSSEQFGTPAALGTDTTTLAPKFSQYYRRKHTLYAEDPVIRSLLRVMNDFFTNEIETNLGLTQVLVDLSTCRFTMTEGWLLTDPTKYEYPNQVPLGDEYMGRKESEEATGNPSLLPGLLPSPKATLARTEPSWNAEDVSPVFAALDRLVKQVESFRRNISDFDKHIVECRATIEADDGTTRVLYRQKLEPRKAHGSQGTSPTRLRSNAQMGSISERLIFERQSGSGSESRTGSPRGRRLDASSTPTLVGRFQHLRISPSRSSSQNSSRDYSPSPLRGGSLASSPPKVVKTFRPLATALQRRINIASASGPVRAQSQDSSSSQKFSAK
jgi:hypothetical protein